MIDIQHGTGMNSYRNETQPQCPQLNRVDLFPFHSRFLYDKGDRLAHCHSARRFGKRREGPAGGM